MKDQELIKHKTLAWLKYLKKTITSESADDAEELLCDIIEREEEIVYLMKLVNIDIKTNLEKEKE